MTLYKTQFQKMYEENQELFDNFREIHDQYALEPAAWQKLFNEYGKEILDIIRENERKLCLNSEKGQFGKFSQNLANKFWNEVRKIFPKIDFVGVTIS
jgi:hypothetical protein